MAYNLQVRWFEKNVFYGKHHILSFRPWFGNCIIYKTMAAITYPYPNGCSFMSPATNLFHNIWFCYIHVIEKKYI